jgi:hypothetical protein
MSLCLVLVLPLNGEDNSSPYENGESFAPKGKIDEHQLENLKKLGITPAKMSSDAAFLRRVHVDLIGTLPTMEEAVNFLSDKSADKRQKLIASLLERDEFSIYWSLKWGDILRVKSEFPINLWPNAVQAYSHWIRNAVQKNMPYDKFARELLTSSGSNFRDPPANFYRATEDRSPFGLAKVAVQAFLGSRLKDWPEPEKKEIEKLFSRVSYKKTSEWKEEIVILNPEPAEKISVNMPDGTRVAVLPGADPRRAFADWLTGPGEKWFAQVAVNRAWFWLFGRGIVHEPDNFVLQRDSSVSWLSGLLGNTKKTNMGNPPCNPELLDFLAGEFIKSGYDFKALLGLIANSATYQQSCIPSSDLVQAEKYFAVYPVRRLDAEVLADALTYLSETSPKYMSVIPEPFTYIPEEQATIALDDGSISSSFLENFGRPARDTGYLMERNNVTTYSQRLFLLNSSVIQNKVTNTPFLKTILKDSKGDAEAVVNRIYLLILSRYPTGKEYETVLQNYAEADLTKPQVATPDKKGPVPAENKKRRQLKNVNYACKQLIWALVNSKEFLFRH